MNGSPVTPRMIVRDAVGATDASGALVSASDRTVELSLDELRRLTVELGAEGIIALVEYLGRLRKETLPGGHEALVLDDFSGRWLHENTGLARNAAWRAQKAVEDSGLFDRIRSATGQGARGRQRAVLNSRLVALPGGQPSPDQDAVDELKVARRGGRPSPLRRKVGQRGNEDQSSFPRVLGQRDNGPDSRTTGNRGNGPVDPASSQVSAVLADSRQADVAPTSDQSSSGEVLHSLQTGTTAGAAGVVPSILIPALATNRDGVVAVVREALNEARYAERLAQVITKLGLEGPASQHVDLLVSVFADLIEHPETVWDTYAALGVTKKPRSLPEDVAVERFILGVVAALGVGTLKTWGGFLGSTVRADWKPMESASLTAFDSKLRAMAHSQVLRERLRIKAYAATERHAAAAESSAARKRRPAEEDAADACDVPDQGAAPSDPTEPATPDAGKGGELGPADLPEHVLAEHLEAAFQNPELTGFSAIAKRGNPAFVRRLVWMHLESTGQLPGVLAS